GSGGSTVALVFSLADSRPTALTWAPVSTMRRPVICDGDASPVHGPGATWRAIGSKPRMLRGRASVHDRKARSPGDQRIIVRPTKPEAEHHALAPRPHNSSWLDASYCDR